MASSLTNSETAADASTASSTSHSTSRGAAEPHTAHPDNYGAKRTLLLYITLSALMFIGRIGTITAATALALRSRRRLYKFPEERPTIG